MAVTDISKVGSVIQVTEVGSPIQCYVPAKNGIQYGFNTAGTSFYIRFTTSRSYNVLLTDLRVQGSGSAPANVAAALTALSTSIFP